jgi:hypothetical protein
MIALLIWILVLCLVFGVIFYVIQLLPLPPPFGTIALAIVGLIFVLVLVSAVLGEIPLRGPLFR